VSEASPEIITHPDAPGYVDLSLYDVDEQELVDRALADAATKLPEWQPREGNTEVALIEAQALQVSETAYALNRLPAIVLQALLVLYNVERDPGTATSGRVAFTLSDTNGHVVPAGTRLRATVSTTGEVVDLVTVEPLEVLSPASVGQVDVKATEAGDAGNGLAAGAVLELVDAVSYVNRVELVAALAGGRDPETDEQLYDRGALLLSRLVSTLVLPAHFTAAALENVSVGRAATLDLYDPGQVGVPGNHGGHITVAVADDLGNPLSATTRTMIAADLASKSHAGLALHVVDPTITTVTVDVTVTRVVPDASAVQAAVVEALQGYLDPAAWPWGGVIYRNEIIALVDRVAGVGRVVSLALNSGATDVTLAGVAPLAKAGTVTVTVQ
jgi:uncharacterized phage protein gp47/JayE